MNVQAVFKLFIEQLREGLEKQGPLYQRSFYLLERLAIVKAFILLVDLDESLVTKLFEMFFSVIRYQLIHLEFTLQVSNIQIRFELTFLKL